MQPFHIQRITSVTDALIAQINPLLDEHWDIEQGKKFLSNPDNALFLAFSEAASSEDMVAGFLTAHRLQRLDKLKAEVLLYEVAVDEKFQQRGIGKALIQAVKDWAKEVGADNVWVLTYASNAAAMRLYQSAGGEEDPPGTRMFTYKID